MQTATTSYRLQAKVEQPGIVYSIARVDIISMECHSLHMTEIMIRLVAILTVQTATVLGGTKIACVQH